MKTAFLTAATLLVSGTTLWAQQWKPYNELGDLYPSYALVVPNLPPNEDDSKNAVLLGNLTGIMGITFTPNQANTSVKLEIRCDKDLRLFEPAQIEVVTPIAGKEYLIRPAISFNQAKLASLSQASTAYVTYYLTINGQKQAPRTEPLRVRSINDCPFALIDEDDKGMPIDFMFAAYVNEEHPWIQEILQEALRKQYVDAFVGYQGDKNNSYRQIVAIWRVLQERGIRYGNSITVASSSKGVASQHVRLLEESIRYTQANCVDATVLLASMLRKIGINPFLVVVPGHMFVGFDLNADGTRQAYLETTLIGVDARETEISKNQLYKTLLGTSTDLKAQVAVKSFVAALNSGNAAFAASKSKLTRKKAGYAVVDISAAREAGVLPIRYVGTAASSR